MWGGGGPVTGETVSPDGETGPQAQAVDMLVREVLVPGPELEGSGGGAPGVAFALFKSMLSCQLLSQSVKAVMV